MKLTSEQCIEAFKSADLETQQYIVAILLELNTAKDKHPNWPISREKEMLEVVEALRPGGIQNFVIAAAIVAEESGELLRAALRFHNEKGRYFDMHKEAIQTGAMALRFLISSPEIYLP